MVQTRREIGRKYFVFRIVAGRFPIGTKTPDQTRDPIGRLHGLIAMAFQLKRWLDKTASLIHAIHGNRRLLDQRRPLVVFVQSKQELFAGVAIEVTMLVDALDRFFQNMAIQGVRIMRCGRVFLALAHIKHKAAKRFDLVEQPIGKAAQHLIGCDIPDGVKSRPLFLPDSGMGFCLFNLEFQKLAFALIELCAEIAHLPNRKHEPGKAKDGAIVMSGIIAGDIGADMPKFIQISDICQTVTYKHENPRFRAGLGMRATHVCASFTT